MFSSIFVFVSVLFGPSKRALFVFNHRDRDGMCAKTIYCEYTERNEKKTNKPAKQLPMPRDWVSDVTFDLFIILFIFAYLF